MTFLLKTLVYLVIIFWPFFSQKVLLNLGQGVPNVTFLRLFILSFSPVLFIYCIFTRSLKVDLVIKSAFFFLIYLIFDSFLHGSIKSNLQPIMDLIVLPVLMYFIIINMKTDKWLIVAVLLSGLIMGGQGILEAVFQRNIFGPEDLRLASGYLRINGPFDDGISYAAIMLLFMPLSYYVYRHKITFRFLEISCFVVVALASVLQLSRACILVEMIAFFTFFVFKSIKSLVIVTFLFVLMAMVFNFYLLNTLQKTGIYADRISDSSNISGRYMRYKFLLSDFQSSPIFGRGYRKISKKMNPHNSYLQSLAELGLVGFGFWLLFILSPIIIMVKRIRGNPLPFDYKQVIFVMLLIVGFIPLTVSALHGMNMLMQYFIISATMFHAIKCCDDTALFESDIFKNA